MAYIVAYQRADGSSVVESCRDFEGAVATAERLRNNDAIERPRIFATNEIGYDFQPYYLVKVREPESSDRGRTVGVAAGVAGTDTPAVETEGAETEGAFGSPAADDSVVEAEPVVYGDPVVDTEPVVDVDDATDESGGLFADFDPSEVEDTADSPSIGYADSEAPMVDDAIDHSFDSDLPVVDAGADVPAPDVPAHGVTADDGEQKTGLFQKMVTSLEGGEGTGGADDVVDDIADPTNPARGLFGR